MANPENRQLRIFGNDVIIGVGIAADSLSQRAKREIVRYQIFTANQTEILIRQNPNNLTERDVITRKELTDARALFGQDRKKFLDDAAARMKGEIIVKAVAGQPQQSLPDITKPKDIESREFEEVILRFKEQRIVVYILNPRAFARSLLDHVIASQIEYSVRENKQISISVQNNSHREFIDLDPEEIKNLNSEERNKFYNELCDKVKNMKPNKVAIMREDPDEESNSVFRKFINGDMKPEF